MAADAGTLIAVGKSGRTYTVDLYVPDAVATLLTFGVSGKAATTSPTYWITPEPVTITDIVIGTAPTAVGATFTANGAAINGGTIRWANQLGSLPNRMRISIPLAGGTQLGALQF
jgi:hypothetical protein